VKPPAPVAATSADEASFAGVSPSVAPSRRLRSAADRAEEAATSLRADAMGGTHSSARPVRARAGVTGQEFESAHLVAQTIGAAINRVLPGRPYSPGRAAATLIRPEAHKAFDTGWVPEWNQAVASGRRVTVAEARSMLVGALDKVPRRLMSPQEQGALAMMIDSELFGIPGVTPDLVILGKP
jgi:hypothetical protein